MNRSQALVQRAKAWLAAAGGVVALPGLVAQNSEAPHRPVDAIMDNSYLVEEAYNQEAGVVQHIVNVLGGVDLQAGGEDRALVASFTQEWPVFSQRHQFSYTIPYVWLDEGAQTEDGLGDIQLNYRFQAWLNPVTLSALAPRFSLVLPTGEERRGTGDGVVGYQFNIPYSRTVGDRWFIHANAGLTYLPDSGWPDEADRMIYNLGLSGIYCVTDRFHLMLEGLATWRDVAVGPDRTENEFEPVISPGFRYAFNLPGDAQLVLGLAAPIGLTSEAADYGALFYLSFEHPFIRTED